MEKNESIDQIKRRTILSTFSLFFQSGYSSVLGLIANLILTIILSPAIFGIYITVLSLIAFLNYFSDIGLAASLIQKKELHDDDVKTTFTIQQLLILSLLTLGFLTTPFIMNFYNLPVAGKFLYWALLISFFLSSLKTIPSVFLERHIKFQKIVLVQVVENTIFYIAVIVLALAGFGLSSFTFGVLLRAITGLILIYSLSFWKPRIGISFRSLKTLLSFGLPFQASSFLALFKDDLIILFLGKMLGFEAVGYIGWAKKWAEAPIRIIMDNLTKVIFPVIARIQDDKEKISKLIERSLYYQTAILAPSLLGIALIMRELVTLLPNYQKWEVALPLLYLFSLSSFFVSYSAPFINLFNALGKVKISFSFMLLWTVLMWIGTPILSNYFGLLGFPLTHLLISSTFVFVVMKAKRLVSFRFVLPIYKFIVAAALMGVVLFFLERYFYFYSYAYVGMLIGIGAVIYYLVVRYVFNVNIIAEIKSFFYEK